MRFRPVWLAATALLAVVAANPSHARAQPASTPEHTTHYDGGSLFPSREASGTAWVPDNTPMDGVHQRWAGWAVMLHGTAFVQYLYEPGDRHRTGGVGAHQGSSVNWGMGMMRRRIGSGRIGARAMISLEPWTVPGCGYLSFLATGEVCDGDTIHDRQHPHDLVMELAADYERPIGQTVRWQIYAGLAGEPAIGPPGFPHRASATMNPLAPIAHHWLDASHVTFGVVTSGVYGARWKAEGSIFNGREPDERRGDIDFGALDSVSGRITWLPSSSLAVQASAARLREAEAGLAGQPRTSVSRFTASVTRTIASATGAEFSTTLAWGANAERELVVLDVLDAVTHAVLIEASLGQRDAYTIFGRAEIVQKPAHDLHAHEYGARILTVGKIQLGYTRMVATGKGASVNVGATATLSLVPPALAPRYDGRAAPGLALFLNVKSGRRYRH
jgi:hypothetical protein